MTINKLKQYKIIARYKIIVWKSMSKQIRNKSTDLEVLIKNSVS